MELDPLGYNKAAIIYLQGVLLVISMEFAFV